MTDESLFEGAGRPRRQRQPRPEGPQRSGWTAPFTEWACVDENGARQGHDDWEEEVAVGAMPTCPTCGGHRAFPVDVPNPLLV